METVKIDVNSIPQEIWDAGCSTLSFAIHKMFENEEIRKDFEKWKEEQKNGIQ